MSSSVGHRLISDHEYRQRVRRFKPSSLLPLIAADSSRYPTMDLVLRSPGRTHTPWALADAARVSLACGTEHNRRDATEDDLQAVLDAYNAFDEPAIRAEDLPALLLRMANQQFTWQEEGCATLARTFAVLDQPDIDHRLECIKPGWDTELFGFSLKEYVGTVQLVWAAALHQLGRFDPSIYEGAEGQDFGRHVSRDAALGIINTHFAIDQTAFRAQDPVADLRGDRRELRRFTFNPLRDRPLLTGFGSGYLCPSPHLVWAKAGLWNIYFTGLRRFGEAFTRDLGRLFERYIGEQLRLLDNASVLPEIAYTLTTNGSTRLSTDWIVVFEDLVLLVEVKSMVPTEPIRLGEPAAAGTVIDKLAKACKQIDTTADLIKQRHPSFIDIPADRPILGVAVTLEPIYLANARIGNLLPSSQTSVCVAGASDIESMVTIDDAPVSILLKERDACEQRSTWDLSPSLQNHAHRVNLVLERAWQASPWVVTNQGAPYRLPVGTETGAYPSD